MVLNPRTSRLEPLALNNVFLGDSRSTLDRPDQLPINVDLTGQIRGRCRACTVCGGYERHQQHAANENDIEVLRCARCGCQSNEHEPL